MARLLYDAETLDRLLHTASRLSSVIDWVSWRMSALEDHSYADDDGWVESDHPRGPDGKFLSYKAQMHLTKSVYAHGMHKVKKSNKLEYEKEGSKLVFEPPTGGKKFAGSFSFYPAGGGDVVQGSGIQALEQALASLGKPVKGFVTGIGFEKVASNAQGTLYKKGDATLWVGDDGKWVSHSPGHLTKEGIGTGALEQLMMGKATSGPWSNTNVTPAEMMNGPQGGLSSTAEDKTLPQHKVLLKKLEKHAPQGTLAEHQAVNVYTGSEYKSINNALRHDNDQGHYTETVSELTTWLDKASLPEDVTLFRKVGGEYAKILKSIVCKGAVFRDRGFMSTSPNPGVWHGDLKMEILAKKGAKVAAVSHHSQHKHEDEVLVQRGYSMKVIDMDFKNNYLKVELLEVTPNE